MKAVLRLVVVDPSLREILAIAARYPNPIEYVSNQRLIDFNDRSLLAKAINGYRIIAAGHYRQTSLPQFIISFKSLGLMDWHAYETLKALTIRGDTFIRAVGVSSDASSQERLVEFGEDRLEPVDLSLLALVR